MGVIGAWTKWTPHKLNPFIFYFKCVGRAGQDLSCWRFRLQRLSLCLTLGALKYLLSKSVVTSPSPSARVEGWKGARKTGTPTSRFFQGILVKCHLDFSPVRIGAGAVTLIWWQIKNSCKMRRTGQKGAGKNMSTQRKGRMYFSCVLTVPVLLVKKIKSVRWRA